MKSSVNKKGDGTTQSKTSKPVEPEDVEVNKQCLFRFLNGSLLVLNLEFCFSCLYIYRSSWFAACLQPTEMSLDEIESRLGSLIQADTVSQLKSAVWKERLEGLSFFSLELEPVSAFINAVFFPPSICTTKYSI